MKKKVSPFPFSFLLVVMENDRNEIARWTPQWSPGGAEKSVEFILDFLLRNNERDEYRICSSSAIPSKKKRY